jgi:hypothetical protein
LQSGAGRESNHRSTLCRSEGLLRPIRPLRGDVAEDGTSRARKGMCTQCSCRARGYLKRTAQSLRHLAAAADAADLVVDVRILLIKDIPGDRRRFGNVGSTGLAVADRRRPGSGCRFFSGHRRAERRCQCHSVGSSATSYNLFSSLRWRRPDS